MYLLILFLWGKINRCNNFTELLSVYDDEEYPSNCYVQHQQLSPGSIAASSESFKTKQKHKSSSKICGTATDC